jgi:hypothetical protein
MICQSLLFIEWNLSACKIRWGKQHRRDYVMSSLVGFIFLEILNLWIAYCRNVLIPLWMGCREGIWFRSWFTGSLFIQSSLVPTLSSDLLVIYTTSRETAVMKQKLYAQWRSYSLFVMVLYTFLWHLCGVWHCASDEVYVIRSLEEYTVLFSSRSKFTVLIHQDQVCYFFSQILILLDELVHNYETWDALHYSKFLLCTATRVHTFFSF